MVGFTWDWWNPNVSFHQHYDKFTKPENRLVQKPYPAALPLDHSKVYLLMWQSDYDCPALAYYHMPRVWIDQASYRSDPDCKIAWTLGPAIIDYYPAIAEYYYKTATSQDFFGAGVSGSGYANPTFFTGLDWWWKYNTYYFDKMNYKSALLWDQWNVSNNNSTAVLNCYSKFATCGVYTFSIKSALNLGTQVFNQMAVSHSGDGIYPEKTPDQNANAVIAITPASTGKARFVSIRTRMIDMPSIKAAMQRLYQLRPNTYVVCTLAEFNQYLRLANSGDAGHRSTYVSDSTPLDMALSKVYSVPLTIRNEGAYTWNANSNVRASYHWRDTNYNDVIVNGDRTNLASAVAPAQTISLNAQVTSPGTAGDYMLQWQMVEDGVTWFYDYLHKLVYVANPSVVASTATVSTMLNDNVATADIIVSLNNNRGRRVPGTTNAVTFSVSGPGTLVGTNPISAVDGIATIKVKSTTQPGTITVTVTGTGLTQSQVSIQTAGVTKITCSANPVTLPPDGTSTSLIAGTFQDNNGNTVTSVNGPVTFGINGSGTWLDGTTSNKQVTSANGVATITAKSGTITGSFTVSATVTGLISSSTTVSVAAGAATKILTNAVPTGIIADGLSISSITATLVDDNNNVVTTATDTIRFSITGQGTWLDGTTAYKQVVPVSGIATLPAKSTVRTGSFRVDTIVP
jgi:hypothetical protein